MVAKIDFTDLDETVTEPIILEKKIPKQMPLTLEAESIQASSEAAGQLTAVATVGSATSQIFMAGALSQVWGLINGLQLFVHIPLFKLSLHANA